MWHTQSYDCSLVVTHIPNLAQVGGVGRCIHRMYYLARVTSQSWLLSYPRETVGGDTPAKQQYHVDCGPLETPSENSVVLRNMTVRSASAARQTFRVWTSVEPTLMAIGPAAGGRVLNTSHCLLGL